MTDDARLWEVFLDIQAGLPRQGPGNAAATRRALSMCVGLPEAPAVLDIGCGPGLHSLILARDTGGHVTAVDLCRDYLDQLAARARAEGLADRIATLEADMAALPFQAARFDLIWAEASAYSMGVGAALKAWKPFLKPGGFLAFSDLCWVRADPSAEARAFFAAEYPDMRDVPATLALMRAAGLTPLGHFTLDEAAWWDDYYTPLEAKLPAMKAKYAGDEAALAVVAQSEAEIALRRDRPGDYGYEFFIGRRS